jgi:purine-cytosine permease-like protein
VSIFYCFVRNSYSNTIVSSATGVYIAIAIPGYTHFEQVLENFMDLIGYWLAIYEGISLTDHFVFKRSMNNYNPADYENPKGLPPGIAAVTAFCFGVAGMVTGSKFLHHSRS